MNRREFVKILFFSIMSKDLFIRRVLNIKNNGLKMKEALFWKNLD